MKKQLGDDIVVTHTMGGMMEFFNTGVYPDKLEIVSRKYDKVWRIKLKQDNRKGLLRVNRKVVYNYVFNDDGFSVQEVSDGVAVSEWVQIAVIEILQD